MGIDVGPGADQSPAGTLEMFHEPEDRVGVSVGPAADRVDGAVDRAIVLADRAVAPECVASLMGEPRDEGHGVGLEALKPKIAPTLTHHARVGRPADHAENSGAPGDAVVQ